MVHLIITLLLSILPPCPTEDANMCTWDASVQGNKSGTSFIALTDDFVIFLDK
jgi:hypothetical protein